MRDTLAEFITGETLHGTPVSVYIAGPMSGYHRFNEGNFNRVAGDLRRTYGRGLNVISPVELDAGEDVDYDRDVTDDEYRCYLLRDLKAILEGNASAIVVLEGWKESKGAALEVHVARHLGLPIYDEDGMLVKEPTKYRPPTDENVAETAQRLVGGDRQDQYGHPIDDFTRTAGVINALYGTSFGPRDIPIIMTAVKLSRVIQSPDKRDSIVDAIGYMLTYEMVAEKEESPLR